MGKGRPGEPRGQAVREAQRRPSPRRLWGQVRTAPGPSGGSGRHLSRVTSELGAQDAEVLWGARYGNVQV